MTKRNVTVMVRDCIDIDGMTFHEMSEMMDALVSDLDKGLHSLHFDIYDEPYCDTTTTCVRAYREETDEEYEARVGVDAANVELQKEFRRKQFETLKKEFG